MPEPAKKDHPKTLKEAVERLLKEISQEDKNRLKQMIKDDLFQLHFDLGLYIRNSMGLHEDDSELMQDCCPEKYKCEGFLLGFQADDCSMIIIEALWQWLQENIDVGEWLRGR